LQLRLTRLKDGSKCIQRTAGITSFKWLWTKIDVLLLWRFYLLLRSGTGGGGHDLSAVCLAWRLALPNQPTAFKLVWSQYVQYVSIEFAAVGCNDISSNVRVQGILPLNCFCPQRVNINLGIAENLPPKNHLIHSALDRVLDLSAILLHLHLTEFRGSRANKNVRRLRGSRANHSSRVCGSAKVNTTSERNVRRKRREKQFSGRGIVTFWSTS
jgi:hypothetical protein